MARLLLTADLHDRADWRAWILRSAPGFDLVAIAGDVLDLFSEEVDTRQIPHLWLRHQPPALPELWDRPPPAEDPFLEAIQQWQPKAVLSGHYHNAPFRQGGSPTARVGRTLCVNSGFRAESTEPMHQIIEL